MKYFLALVAVLAAGFFTLLPSEDANAANKNDFNPGYIIDDYVFYNAWAMDSSQIQNFLNAKNPNCDYWGTQPASDWGRSDITHAQLAEYKRNGTNGYSQDSGFHAPPYRCLTHYTQSTPQMEAASGYCSAIGAGNRTAAQIINDVAKACNINPQVLIILLEKEQSLITDDWPLNRQLQKATGFACPDTAPCNPAYEGFFYQVYNAARQFKVYQAFPNNYNYRAGRANNIYWNPDKARCGSSSVYIQNQATAALYIYTPYRPNDAALNNLYGTGDSCSSYGNRNFWRIFTDWFGSTKAHYISLDTPRWMVLNKDQLRMSPGSNAPYSDPNNTILPAGTQLKFVSKIWADNQWYFRTEFNTNLGVNVAIPASSVNEITFQPLDTPRWMKLSQDSSKYTPLTERGFGPTHKADQNIRFVDKIQVNGVWYFRTALDAELGNNYGIPAGRIQEAEYKSFDTPRWMEIKSNTATVDPITGVPGDSIVAGSQVKFTKKIQLANKLYFQSEADEGTNFAIDNADIAEIAYTKILETPQASKWMQLKQETNKVHPSSGAIDSIAFPAGRQIKFSESITINGIEYLRTTFDADQDTDLAIPASDIEEIDFVALDTPRQLKLRVGSAKTYVKSDQDYPYTHPAGQVIMFTSKIHINGVWYLRSEYDTLNNVELGIPQNKLIELN